MSDSSSKKTWDFTKYKSQIALPDFLIDNFNFVPVDGSTFCNPKLKSRVTGQTLVIKMNKQGFYTYFDVHDDSIKGKSILDFLQNELAVGTSKPSLFAIAETLENYIKSGKVIKPDNSKFYLTRNDNDIKLLLNELKPLTDRSFLSSRGISDDVLNADTFKDVFLEREFIKDSVKHTNLVVKLFNKDGVAGLSQRNHQFKGCLLSRFDSLAISNFDPHRPIDIVFLAESMIDAASHFQLNCDRLQDKNIVYVSSEGSLTSGQIGLLQNIMDHRMPHNFVSITDRDIAGQEYNLKLWGSIVIGEDSKNIHVEVVGNSKEQIETVKIALPDNIAEEKRKVYTENFFSESVTGNVHFSSESDKDRENWTITFPRTYENIDVFINKIKTIRFPEAKIFRNIPLTNDFNDDLRAKLGIHKNWRIDIVDGKPKGFFLETNQKQVDMSI